MKFSTPADLSEEHDSFADDAVPKKPERLARADRPLQPWHKPRKQFVRREWVATVRRLMRELRFQVGAPKIFRYFTLPAPEMLDIRTLESTAKKEAFRVQYVGFTDARDGSNDDRQLQLGQASLRAKDDWVHSESEILYYRLEDLAAGPSPVARQKLEQFGPFHAINIDLCDYLFAPGPRARVLEALEQLIVVQTTRQHDDWLLFVATRFDSAQTCGIKFERLKNAIAANCGASKEFKDGLDELLKVSAGGAEEIIANPTTLSQDHLRDVICVGLTKWLTAILLKASPPFELEMLPTYVYAVDGSKQDMLSLVYRCCYRGSPAPVSGAIDINPTSAATAAREVALAIKALKQTRRLIDIDARLAGDAVTRQELVDETIGLLRQANYDEAVLAGYSDWAAKECEKAIPYVVIA